MNLESLHRTLLDAARRTTPSDRVPHAFDQRVLARLRAVKAAPMAVWHDWFWRAALTACALALVTGAVSFVQADLPLDESEPALELASNHLEAALFAPATAGTGLW